MYQIVKFVGLNPNQVVSLHEILGSESVLGTHEEEFEVNETKGDYMNWDRARRPHAELISCRLDKDHGTYTAEVRVCIMKTITKEQSGRGHKMAITGRNVINAIYNALDIYPEEEKILKTEVV